MKRVITALAATAISSGLASATATADPAPIQLERTIYSGSLSPFTAISYGTETVAPGVVRVTRTRLCNTINRGFCLWFAPVDSVINWTNTSTGAAGTAIIGPSPDPVGSVDIATGPGQVTAFIFGTNTVVPGYAAFGVG